MPAGGSLRPASHETVDQRLHYVKQDGADGVQVRGAQDRGDLRAGCWSATASTGADLDLFVSHQANRRIIMSAAEQLGLPTRQGRHQHRRYGNTTAATIPLALNDAVADGRLKKGSLVLLASVGAGFTVGSVLLRWGI